MKNNKIITIHHRLPDSWGWNLRPNNAMKLRQNVHRALHTVFQDDTPIQRLRRSLEADKPVILPSAYMLIHDSLRRLEELEIEIYEPDCFNSDKFLHKLWT